MILSVFASHLAAVGGGYGSTPEFERGLEFGRSLGITAVEADSGEFAALEPSAYKALLAAHGMKMSSVHHITRLSACDEEIYNAALEGCYKACDDAARSGAEFFMLVPADLSDFVADGDKAAARQRIITAMNKIADYINATGMTMTIENFSKTQFPFSRADEMRDMAENIPALMLTIDSGNFSCVGESCIDGYDKIKDRLVYLHVKDWRLVEEGGLLASDGKRLEGCELGRGIVPVGELFARLKYDRFNGVIVIEQESTGPDKMPERLTRAAEYIKRLI